MSFDQLKHDKYISLVTFRKDGTPVATPVWFAERDGKLYVKTRADSGKVKRLRRNARVSVAPATFRGKVTGRAIEATARVLPENEWTMPRALLGKKYLFARLSLFEGKNVYIEIAQA
jgi:PPOX class probable F420-dependent enzyme